MKKMTALFFLLLLTCLGATLWIQTSFLQVKDQVTFEDRVLYGKAEDINGLTIRVESAIRDIIFWDTSYTGDSVPEVKTNYNFYPFSAPKRPEDQTPYLHMSFAFDEYVADFDPKADYSKKGAFEQKLYEMYHTAQETGIFSHTIHLKDYFDYYPLEFYSHTLNLTGTEKQDYYLSSLHSEALGSEAKKNYEILQNYFRIPVKEDDGRTLLIEKQNGQLNHIQFGSMRNDGEGTDYYLQTYCTSSEDAIYFTFNTVGINTYEEADRTSEARFDTSLIPGGYGIYKIPYETDKNGVQQARVDQISTVCSLDPAIDLYNFFLTKDQSRLVLSYTLGTGKDKISKVDIRDRKTMELLQSFTLDSVEQENGLLEVLLPYNGHVYDDFFVVSCSGQYLAVFPREENGDYRLDYVVDFSSNPVFQEFIASPDLWYMDYKDGKLAIVNRYRVEYDHEVSGWGDYLTCGFYVAVFDKDGLVHYSTHESSLDKGVGHMARQINFWPSPNYYQAETTSLSRADDPPPIYVEWK